ncbi:hypothetical protein HAX54_029205 [Datura stramonium]|uniref:BRCA2 OB1 domain-containing protein n=1 Tax=Datura stramonium TaxID=4076 RepID=A0ABS8V837_DATST|nr:hypothetical protein [Datura stramonium]
MPGSCTPSPGMIYDGKLSGWRDSNRSRRRTELSPSSWLLQSILVLQNWIRKPVTSRQQFSISKNSFNLIDEDKSVWTQAKELEEENGFWFSGSRVPESLWKALGQKRLLGLEENGEHETFPVEGIASTESTNVSAASLSPFDVKFNSVCPAEELVADFLHCADKPPPIKFHTAGGRSISVSCEGIERETKSGPVRPHQKVELSDTPVSLLPGSERQWVLKPFYIAIRDQLCIRKKSLIKTENLVPQSNLIKEFDAWQKENHTGEGFADRNKNFSGRNMGKFFSPFKKPSANIVALLQKKRFCATNGFSNLAPKLPSQKGRFQFDIHSMWHDCRSLPDSVRRMVQLLLRVLCSIVNLAPVALDGPQSSLTSTTENGTCAKVELTDGWYSIIAVLDILLSKKLAAGKLFVGQKLRIWGAGLSGWTGPVSALGCCVSGTTSLLLHINGTYRAHWASRLGFCKGDGIPLSFMSIKDGGGAVPVHWLGFQGYILFSSGKGLAHAEGAGWAGLYNKPDLHGSHLRCWWTGRSIVVEGVVSESQRENRDAYIGSDYESKEGARILRILERAAEPELLMAEMTSEQLNLFSSYQAKLEALRQSDLQKSLEKALQAAGLAERDVTPFMRVRVVGLTSKNTPLKCCPKEVVQYGLTPVSSDSSTLYLQTKGSTVKWLPLSPLAIEHFEDFFCPRQSISLSELGEVPMSREFDIAAVVVFVGQLYARSSSNEAVGTDLFAPINSNLVGSTVCFCNLIKRARVLITSGLEATENSTYYLDCSHSHCSHLKDTGASAERWAKISGLRLEKLRGKSLSIIS